MNYWHNIKLVEICFLVDIPFLPAHQGYLYVRLDCISNFMNTFITLFFILSIMKLWDSLKFTSMSNLSNTVQFLWQSVKYMIEWNPELYSVWIGCWLKYLLTQKQNPNINISIVWFSYHSTTSISPPPLTTDSIIPPPHQKN